jgi:hypothetical protein
MGTPGNGWAAYYEAAEEGRDWLAEQEDAAARAALELQLRMAENRARVQAKELLRDLRAKGLLRHDRLSYTRICELEWETGQQSGSPIDYYHALREAQRLDEQRRA